MHVGLDKATTERIDDLVGALDRQSTANTRLAAAVEAHTEAIWASNPVKPTHQPLADDLMAMAQRCRDRHESAGTVGDEGTR